MAKDITGPIWVFDAVGQMEGQANFSDNPTDVNFNSGFYIQLLRLINPSDATETEFEVVEGDPDTPTDSASLTGLINVAAGTEQEVWVGTHVDGCYVLTLPTGGEVHVVHGYP